MANGADKGEHLKPKFLKVNPLGKVPAFRDGDYLLAESPEARSGSRDHLGLKLGGWNLAEAQAGWSCQGGEGEWVIQPGLDNLEPTGLVDEYLVWQHVTIQLPATNIYLSQGEPPWPNHAGLGKSQDPQSWKSLLPHFSKQPVDAAQLEGLLGRLTPALQHLDGEVLAARPFLATEQVSLAELMALSELMQPTAVSCEFFEDWPQLAAEQTRVQAALGSKLVQEAHNLILQPWDT
ncbi:glutathione S-transferase theta-1-like [Cynocephalus volans]|uniref:glutathione S-transferase theta-1-like n=1 Tax=Cynocephalus volans TaxID=110931 RepID=UPI002FCC5C7A